MIPSGFAWITVAVAEMIYKDQKWATKATRTPNLSLKKKLMETSFDQALASLILQASIKKSVLVGASLGGAPYFIFAFRRLKRSASSIFFRHRR